MHPGPGERFVEESVIITTRDQPPPRQSPHQMGGYGPRQSPGLRRPAYPAESMAESAYGGAYGMSQRGPAPDYSFAQTTFAPQASSSMRQPDLPSRYQQYQPSTSVYDSGADPASSSVSSRMFEEERRLSTPTYKKKGKKGESVLQWFDRSCERELSKRQMGPYDALDVSNIRGLERPEMVEATASGIDIAAMLRGEQNTELYEACDKLAKAQAMDIFKGAVKAAEIAAANAPPEYAEEAAAAGARGYQAELTSVVQERVGGVRPMEVIGYVGVTRPKHPKKTKS